MRSPWSASSKNPLENDPPATQTQRCRLAVRTLTVPEPMCCLRTNASRVNASPDLCLRATVAQRRVELRPLHALLRISFPGLATDVFLPIPDHSLSTPLSERLHQAHDLLRGCTGFGDRDKDFSRIKSALERLVILLTWDLADEQCSVRNNCVLKDVVERDVHLATFTYMF